MKDSNVKPYTEEAFGSAAATGLPASIRWTITTLCLLVILWLVKIYMQLIEHDPGKVDPEKYGLPSIFISALVILVLVNIPWNKLGMRIKKIGMVELEQVVTGQAESNADELADLQTQIDDLKKLLQRDVTANVAGNDLDTLILKFLQEYNRWAFSAARIYNWGSERKGFEDFQKYKIQDIRESLRRLLAEDKLTTQISKSGNTIYKIK